MNIIPIELLIFQKSSCNQSFVIFEICNIDN